MKRSKFEKLIQSAPEIPTLPVVATRIMRVVRNPNSAAADLEGIVMLDPVLASKVMWMVNSAYFGLAHEINDLRRAIVMLGFNSIRNLAFATCLKSLYRTEYRCGTFTAGSLWLHSVSVAVIAKMVADHTWPELGDEAFLAGIIHDVGIIVEWNLLPDRFGLVIRYSEGTGLRFQEAEKQALGFDHCACGASILRRWRLPRHLVRIARHHHDSRRQDEVLTASDASLGDRLAAVVHLAECVCAERGNGFFDEPRNHDLTKRLLECTGCGWEAYREIVDGTEAELERARDILAL